MPLPDTADDLFERPRGSASLRLSGAWLEVSRALALAERVRLLRTVRYQLGRLWLGTWRDPRPVADAAPTALKGPSGTNVGAVPPVHPPYPTPRAREAAPVVTRGIEPLRAEVRRLWQDNVALEQSAPFRVGEALLGLLGHARLLRAIGRELREAKRPSTAPATPPWASLLPLRAETDAGPPGFRCIGPAWLEEMLAQEGVAAQEPGQPADGPLLLAVDSASQGAPGSKRLPAEAPTSPFALWLLDGDVDPAALPAGALERATRTFVADPELFRRLADIRSVELLLPAVQPRLHNPIGWWRGRSEEGVRGKYEERVPAPWRRLIARARGLPLAAPDDPETPELWLEPTPPSWMNRSWADDWLRHQNLRRVLREAPIASRVARIDAALGGSWLSPQPPLATVLVCTRRPEHLESVLDNFERQGYAPRELVLVLHGEAFDRALLDRLLERVSCPAQVLTAPSRYSLGEALQLGTEAGHGAVYCRMDDDDWYGPDYVGDFVRALSFSDAPVATKVTHVMQVSGTNALYLCHAGLEYCYTAFRGGGCRLAFSRDVLSDVRWRAVTHGEDTWFLRDLLSLGFPMLATDRFNFVYRRAAATQHTSPPPRTWRVPRLPRGARIEDLR